MKTIRTILTILIGLAFVIGVGLATEAFCEAQTITLDDLPTLEYVQTVLFQLGYLDDANDIDLIYGPKTDAAWQRAECQKAYLKTLDK